MKSREVHSLGIFLLIIFAAAILLDGKYSPSSSELVTIHVDGIADEAIADKVREVTRMIEGVQTVFIDEKSNLCTFRYDSGKIDLEGVEKQMAGFGIKFTPVESVKILEPDSQKDRKKLISITINNASNQ
ncbi:MAG: hypothetical protein J7L86_05555 [Candidatus Marinimicrobia bacterium]|nr:hypothetical protein [Candidatus Neomarinimicrobiota bacterium]